MKKFFVFFAVFLVIAGPGALFAQENDNRPYLSDEDIAAIETVLPFDAPENLKDDSQTIARTHEADKEDRHAANEMARLNSSRTLYHLLILDRIHSPLNSDIDGAGGISILYNFKHGTNGYLVAIYKSSEKGPVFPVLPEKSRILVNLITVQKSMIQDYVNSGAFKRLITNRAASAQLKDLFETGW